MRHSFLRYTRTKAPTRNGPDRGALGNGHDGSSSLWSLSLSFFSLSLSLPLSRSVLMTSHDMTGHAPPMPRLSGSSAGFSRPDGGLGPGRHQPVRVLLRRFHPSSHGSPALHRATSFHADSALIVTVTGRGSQLHLISASGPAESRKFQFGKPFLEPSFCRSS